MRYGFAECSSCVVNSVTKSSTRRDSTLRFAETHADNRPDGGSDPDSLSLPSNYGESGAGENMPTRKQIVDEFRRVKARVRARQQEVSLLMLDVGRIMDSGRDGITEGILDQVVKASASAVEALREMQAEREKYLAFCEGREATSPPEATVTEAIPGLQPPEEKTAGESPTPKGNPPVS